MSFNFETNMSYEVAKVLAGLADYVVEKVPSLHIRNGSVEIIASGKQLEEYFKEDIYLLEKLSNGAVEPKLSFKIRLPKSDDGKSPEKVVYRFKADTLIKVSKIGEASNSADVLYHITLHDIFFSIALFLREIILSEEGGDIA